MDINNASSQNYIADKAGMAPPVQGGMLNLLPANYYQIYLKFGCSEYCKYYCGG